MFALGVVSLFAGTTLAQSNSTTAAMLADAQTRSSLNGEQSSGHDGNGFFLANNGARLNIGGDLQFRYTYNPSRSNSTFGNNTETGFDIPLAKLRFSGYLNETVDFMLETGFENGTDEIELFDAYAGLKVFDHGRFQIGQFRLPFLQEQNVADRCQLAANRSVVSDVFGQGYSQGVQFAYNLDNFRILGAVSDGFDTANTDFTDPAESDLALTARAEYAILGSFNDFTEFTATKSQQNSLLAGTAFHL
jgi:phosphate-selective porin